MKITIFGLAWSWTSTMWKMLSEKLWYKFMSTWNIMRSWADDMWYDLYEFEDKVIKNDKTFDIKLDNKVVDFWKSEDDFIFESRLAWHFIPDSFKIFLYCDESERHNRIFKREWWDLGDIKKKTIKRETELVDRYKSVYSDISFPPEKEKFDLFIDWTNLTPEEILKQILDNLN